MNKLGFYTANFGVQEVIQAIKDVQPPVMVSEVKFKDALRDLRRDWSPDTFVVGRPYVFTPHQQDQILDSDNPAERGARLADRLLHEFPIATEEINGKLVINVWMALNESVRGPNSFPQDQDHNAPDYQEMIRRAAAYDAFEGAFQNRLVEHGLQAIAFNFGAGNWVRAEDFLKHFPQTLASHKYLGFHEYGWPTLNPDEADTSSACGLYRGVMADIRARFGAQHRVIMTEAGLARMYKDARLHPEDNRSHKNADVGWLYPWDSVSEDSHRQSLRWYNERLMEDDYVLGACLFQVGTGPGWDTFRHTGVDNDGRPIRLLDVLVEMSREPAPEPVVAAVLPEPVAPLEPPAPPERTLVETLRDAGEPLVIPLNRSAKFYKVARENDLGERLTGEYEAIYDERSYVAQIHEKGLVYAPSGQWEQTQVVPIARPRTLGTLTGPKINWTHQVTGFHGTRWDYWEQHLRDKIPGLTWRMFMEEALRHNPHLEADGFIFKADKTYVMPHVGEAVVTTTTQPVGVGPSAPDGFVGAVDGQFQLEGQPVRFMGVNIRGLVHYGHDPDYFKHAPIEHRALQLQAATDMNARLVRVFLAHKNATPQEVEGRLRQVLDLIKKDFPDLFLLPALTNLYNDVPFYVKGDDGFYERFPNSDKDMLNHAFFDGGYRKNYLPFVEHIVKAFKDEPRIFAWEIGNELKAEARPDLFVQFNHEVAAAIKGWDSCHLVTTGMVSTRQAWMRDRQDLRRDLYSSPHIDFVTIHAYNGNQPPSEIEDDSDLARAFGKPYIIEEAGFDLRHFSERPEKTRTDLADWYRKGASCYMPWGFVATPVDNNDGDKFVGMTGPLIDDWDELYQVYKQCGRLLLTGGPTAPVSEAIAHINFSPPSALPPAALPWPLVADGFDYPVGKPDGQGYYVAADLVDQSYYAARGAWHTGEDWNRKLRAGDTPDVDLGDPVYAVAHGRVVTSHSFAYWGNIVLIEHRLPTGETVWSQYAHLRQRLVRKGDVVQRGQRIGAIGKGESDRYPAHLHFEIRLKDLPASKWGWKKPEDREKVLKAYAHPTNFINSFRPR